MSNINIPTQVSPFANSGQFPTVGKTRVIYIDQSTNEAYYWNLSTSTYISLGGGASSVDWGSIGGNILDQTDLQNALNNKVDKVTGKGLSTNDYTTAEKNKLAGIQAGAEVNVNADWNATTGDAVILNKPTIPTQTSDLTNDGADGINPFITAGDIPGSLPPSGSAGGDLTGTYPNPTVHRIHGIDIQNGTPSADDVLVYGGSPAKWQHQHLNASQVDNDSSVTGANVELALEHLDSTKQPLLVSATNIKTINGSSVLGSGDLVVSGGGGGGIHSQVKLTSGKQTNLSINASGTNSVAMAANRLFSLPYIPAQTFTCQNLYINVAVAQAASNCRILIYSDLNGIPDQKLYESSNLDSSTVGIKTATTTFTFNQATTYWLAIHSSSNPTLTALGVAQLVPITMTSSISTVCGYNGNATFGSAPTTFPSVINQTGTTPCVFITVA